MKIPVVDQEACIGCGLCVEIAGSTFRLNDDTKSEVIDPQGDDKEAIEEAIESCPVTAITWGEK